MGRADGVDAVLRRLFPLRELPRLPGKHRLRFNRRSKFDSDFLLQRRLQLEAYLRGVEAAGRTHQKPYRDAQNELGLAKRRAELEAKIEAAQLSLLGEGGPEVLNAEAPSRGLPSWFFAVMLEVFSSQATSIALVALLVLASGRRRSRSPGLPSDAVAA